MIAWLYAWLVRKIAAAVRAELHRALAEVLPLLERRIDSRASAASMAETTTVFLQTLDGLATDVRAQTKQLDERLALGVAALQARAEAAQRGLTVLEACAVEGQAVDLRRHEETHTRLQAVEVAVDQARALIEQGEARLAAALQAETARAVERLHGSRETYVAGKLAAWLQKPEGEAVRYAVGKVAKDGGLGGSEHRRKEALRWAKLWLVEHGAEVPPDSHLNFLIEYVVLDSKGA